MARHHQGLPREEVEKIFYQLCVAISKIKSSKEAAEILRDLLSYQEAEMIAKRLKIAEFLYLGKTYDEIRRKLRVSPPTIARVQEWMKIAGEGYRSAIKYSQKNKISIQRDRMVTRKGQWSAIKRKYPSYYWPQILLEDVIANAGKRQRERLQSVISELDKMGDKSELFVRLKRLVKNRI